MSPESSRTSMANNTSHLAYDTYINMMQFPWYFTPDAGCLSLSNNIQDGQQVTVLGGFACCWNSKHQEGPAHQTSPV